MPGTQESRSRIKSVQQTLKITNAMYLISSAKLRRAKGQVEHAAPYFRKVAETIAHILRHTPEMEHPYFDRRPDRGPEERKLGYVVISGDKGLAGAYNHNVIKAAEAKARELPGMILYLVGMVGRAHFQSRDIPVQEDFFYTVQNPTMDQAEEMGDRLCQEFLDGKLDEVHILYTEMVSPMELQVREQKILPLERTHFGSIGKNAGYQRQVEYLPSAGAVMSRIVPHYVRGILFGALVEAHCAEENARMSAMKSASDNAQTMLKELSLTYNRARQAAITQEITEVAGSAGIEGFGTTE